MINFVQVGNVLSTLQIVNYSHGFTGSAHYALAFDCYAGTRSQHK